MIETLLALLAISFCVLLMVPILQIMTELPNSFQNNEDMSAILRLRYLLAQSSSFNVLPSSVQFRYHGEEWELMYHHRNIVKAPGYEIFLMNIEEASFQMKEQCLFLQYQKGEMRYDVILTCEY